MTTILQNSTITVDLANYETGNPFTVGKGTTIFSNSGDAIYGNNSEAWSLTNSGTIRSTGANADGIKFELGGEIRSNAGAIISGYEGVYITGAGGIVTNFGTITAGNIGVDLRDGGTVGNEGTAATITGEQGVRIDGGGSASPVRVNNAGTIIGTSGVGVDLLGSGQDSGVTDIGVHSRISGSSYGVLLSNSYAGGFVSNAGTITGGSDGVLVDRYGSVTNQGVASTIQGGSDGVRLTSGNVINAGTIKGSTDYGVLVDNGTVTNQGSASLIEGGLIGVLLSPSANTGAEISNAGKITGGTLGRGVELDGTASIISNAVGATIEGSIAIYGEVSADTITNNGKILGTGNVAVFLGEGGSVTNGVAAATIAGVKSGILIRGAAGTITNAGTISSKDSDGIALSVGGTVSNDGAKALIEGAAGGVLIEGAAGTIVNHGRIIATGSGAIGVEFSGTFNDTLTTSGAISGGGGGIAVEFGAGNDRLVLEGNAAFTGEVTGGAGTNTLEFAAGAGTDKVSGLGTKFVDFEILTVDKAAAWTFTGTNTLKASETLTNDGTLTVTGTSTFGGKITNLGMIAVASGTLDITSAIGGTGGHLQIDGTATLDLAKAPTTGQEVVFDGSGGTLHLVAPTGLTAHIDGFAKGDRIDLGGFTYGGGETVGFAENSAGTEGTVTIKDGGTSLQIVLFGQFAASGFKLAGDGAGGSVLTYTPSTAAALPLAPGHG